MPQIFNNAVMTNAGKALLSKEIAGECMIQITRMAVGSGVYTNPEKAVDALQELTALKNEVQSTGLSALKRIDHTSVLVSGVFANDADDASDVDYHMNEIGLFAQEKGNKNTEILYSIAVVSAEEGEIMPASNGKNPIRIIQDWIVTVSNSDNATIESLPDGAFAMAADVGNVDELDTTEKGSVVDAINETLRLLIVTDTKGILGKINAEVEAQDLLDGIANQVKEELLSKTGDSAKNTITFTSGDGDTETADQWTDVPQIESGEKHKSLFGKISTMFKNVRYLYNVLGSEDISQLGDGNVTGIVAALKQTAFLNPTNNLLATIAGTSLDAVQGSVLKNGQDDLQNQITQINSDLSKSNLLNAYYDTGVAGDIDPHISDLAFIREKGSSIVGHSNKLLNIGYWIDVLTISNRMFNRASQIAIGEKGIATRSLSHESNKWSEWRIL